MKQYSNFKYGLLGRKLVHSYSPLIHRLFGSENYLLAEVEPEDVGHFLCDCDFKGINVTVPYKREAVKYCDKLSETAEKCGSVNTVIKLPDGTLYGDNTDFFGFSYLLDRNGVDVAGKNCAIIGTGGAAYAVFNVLKERKAREIVFVSHKDNNNDYILNNCSKTEIIINASPVGMFPETDLSPIDLSLFKNAETVVDLIYNPKTTRLMWDAEKSGLKSIGGLLMLVAQAAKSHGLFFEKIISDKIIKETANIVANTYLNIILVGMPGCGKTTVGRILAETLSADFIDTDEIFAAENGMTPADYIKKYGEESFRLAEHETIRNISSYTGKIIATGGGVPTFEKNLFYLKQNSLVFFINRSLSELDLTGRPLSDRNTISEMMKKRLPVYRRIADYEIEFTTAEKVAKKAADIYNSLKEVQR